MGGYGGRGLLVRVGGLVLMALRGAAGCRALQLFLIGGLIFVFFFYWRYGDIPGELYQTRDDGVITMSHARNLVDYGFIGVNPSGERVEGFSAPAQFWVYAGVYALTGVGYDAFAAGQTAVGTFLLGAVFILFFRGSRLWAVIITALAGLLLSWHYPFLAWHGSGMENAITHVLFLAAALVLFTFMRNGRIVYPWAVVVFLASISRLDSIYYIGPGLVIFSLGWWLAFRGTKRGMGGCYFSLAVVGLWAGYNFWRYAYFGDWMPNTAYAQGIAAGGWLERLGESGWDWVNQYARDHLYIFVRHGVYILPAALPLLYFARRNRAALLMLAVIGYVIAAGSLSPFFFGSARLDGLRTTTHLVVFVVLGLGLIIYQIKSRRIENRKILLGIASGLALGVMGVVVFNTSFNTYIFSRYYLCCEIRGHEFMKHQFVSLAGQEGLLRPAVSNSDLGVLSWHKHFNTVDLGRLGSPVISKLYHHKAFHPFSDYFFDYAAPDFIKLQGPWSSRYHRSILTHPEFEKHYRKVDVVRIIDGDPVGVWVRVDVLRGAGSAERELIDALAGELSVGVLRRELADCQSVAGADCVYVARTAYRFLPEFRDAGLVDELVEVFSDSRTRDYDLYLINGYRDGQAHLGAIEFVVNSWVDGLRRDGPVISSDYDVFVRDGALIYVKSGCGESGDDVEARFFVHLYPADSGDLSIEQARWGFNNLGFNFSDYGLRVGGHCIAEYQLPGYDIGRIRTGQFSGDGQLWVGDFEAGR